MLTARSILGLPLGRRGGGLRGKAAPAVLVSVLAAVAIVLPLVAPPAVAQPVNRGIGLTAVPLYPPSVTVGARNVPVSLVVANDRSVLVGPVTITRIEFDPACKDTSTQFGCSNPDQGVFDLPAIGTGVAGACTGRSFTISGPDATGTFTFQVIGAPLVLQPPGDPLSFCEIAFTLDVLMAPTADAIPAVPGLQTRAFAFVEGTGVATDTGTDQRGTGTGTTDTTVLQAAPQINTVATPSTVLTGAISDTATVTGPDLSPTPTGSVTFTLFGPDNPTCAGPPVFTSTSPLVAGPAPLPNDATANSGLFTPIMAGTYNWVAVYSGNANFTSAISPCGAPNEISVVSRPVATINTVATPDADIGGSITDTATVGFTPANAPMPTGTVTFTLFNNVTCTGLPVFTSTIPLTNGTATSGAFTPTTAGVYSWVATYNGDGLFQPVSAACGAPNETSNILAASPEITTDAPEVVPVGTAIRDVATLSGGFAPTGTITFDLYGPGDELCAGTPVFTSTVPVAGNGPYTSGAFTPTQPGTYRWIATYNGDANNTPVAGVCGEPNEITRVLGAPLINVVKTATPTTRLEPGGTFTFNVVVTNTGPNQLTITSLVDSVEGGAPQNLALLSTTCARGVGTVLAADPDGPGAAVGGTFRCSFDREFTGLGGASQDDVVTVIGTDEVGQTATDDDDATINITDVAPNIQVVKTASPETLPEPGGTFTFTVLVTNTSIEPVTITSLTDDKYPNIASKGTCTNAIGSVLPANGGTYSCTFPGEFLGTAEGPGQTDIVTVIGVDDEGTSVTDNDDAHVGLTDVLPTVEVIKTADPGSLPEPGGTFTFTVVVRNTSVEPVTITSLTDDKFGNLSTKGTCIDAIGTSLPVGGTYTCEFEGAVEGNAGDVHRNVVTVIVEDDEDNPATDTDDARVTLTPVAPTVQVVKTATPEVRPAPGGEFTFLVVVTNTSAEEVTITSLVDDIHGNIATQGTCRTAVGTKLAPGGTYTCSFVGTFTGPSGSQRDVVTVVVTDDDNQTATDDDDATVTITPGAPPAVIDRAVNRPPASRIAPVTPVVRIAGTRTLPRTGSAVPDLATMALGLITLGGLLLLTASRWAPSVRRRTD